MNNQPRRLRRNADPLDQNQRARLRRAIRKAREVTRKVERLCSGVMGLYGTRQDQAVRYSNKITQRRDLLAWQLGVTLSFDTDTGEVTARYDSGPDKGKAAMVVKPDYADWAYYLNRKLRVTEADKMAKDGQSYFMIESGPRIWVRIGDTINYVDANRDAIDAYVEARAV